MRNQVNVLFTILSIFSNNYLGTPAAKVLSLDEIRKTRKRYPTYSIPDSIDPKADAILILNTVENWDIPTDKLIKHTESCLSKHLLNAADSALSQWRALPLYSKVIDIVKGLISHLANQQRETPIQRALGLERSFPCVERSKLWIYVRDGDLKDLQEHRLRVRTDIAFEEQYALKNKRTLKEKRDAQTPDNLKQFLGDRAADPFEEEIAVAAKIRAYYDIASERFVGNVIQSLGGELFEQVKNQMEDALLHGLELDTGDRKCAPQLPAHEVFSRNEC